MFIDVGTTIGCLCEIQPPEADFYFLKKTFSMMLKTTESCPVYF